MHFDNYPKTPWHECSDQVLDDNASAILRATPNPLDKNAHFAAVQRIVACVNACQGIKTEALEQAVSVGSVPIVNNPMIDKLIKRSAQRDELLAALEGADKALIKAMPYLPADEEAVLCGEWLEEIREVIAHVKGGAA